MERAIADVLPCDRCVLVLFDKEKDVFRVHALAAKTGLRELGVGTEIPRKGTVFETLAKQGPVVVQDLQEEKGLTGPDEKLREMGIRSVVSVPLIGKSGFVGSLAMGSVEPNRYTQRDGLFLQEAGEQICLALENMEAYEEIALLKQRLEHENLYLQEEIKIQHDFEDIIGDRPGDQEGTEVCRNGRAHRRHRSSHQ